MALEDSVNDLVTATTDLLNAVNVAKETLDDAVASADVDANAASASAIASANSAASALAIYGNTSVMNAAVASATASATTATTKASEASTSATQAAASASSAAAIVTGVASNRPSIRPSLLLDFEHTKQLDPRITFSRASTGTYYNGKTVAKAEENLLTYSQEFDNAAWTSPASSVTVTANASTAPDGTSTADRLQGLTASWYRAQNVTLTSGASYTLSMYVKSNTGSSQTFRLFGSSSVASSEFTATTSWQLFTHTFTATSSTLHGITRDLANNTVDLLIWGAQLEQRSAVTAYTPTTTAPITNYIHALQTAASGTARFDHDPVTGESKGLLIEEQRTNLLTYSEQFDNAAWTKQGVTILANTAVAPDGTLTADKVVEDTSTGFHRPYQTPTVSGASQTFSFYVKQAGRNWIFIRMSDGTNTARNAFFNISTGVVGSVDAAYSATSIQSVGNGWFRCSASLSSATSGAPVSISTTTGDNIGSSVGDGTSGIYVWGAQLEAGSFPTSYIPTVASQVTRSADSASMTGSNFSSWYRADEGTLYVDAVSPNVTGNIASYPAVISDGSGANYMGTYRSFAGSTNRFTTIIQRDFSSAQGMFNNTVDWGSSTPTKIGFAYKFNDASVVYNASSPITDTSTLIPIVNRLGIGVGPEMSQNFWNSTIKRIAYYPKRLSNTELQGITS